MTPATEQVSLIDLRGALAISEARTEERIRRGEQADPLLCDPLEEPQAILPLLSDLLDETAHLILRYTHLPVASLAMLCGCWIALTYTYEHFRYCGYLALRSATP
jgi:hypothetical protein